MRITKVVAGLCLFCTLTFFIAGCNDKATNNSNPVQPAPGKPTPSDADLKKSNFEGLKVWLSEAYDKLYKQFNEPETAKQIAIANRPADEMPKLEKRYAEAKAADAKAAELDAIVAEYARIADEADAALRKILNTIKPTLKDIETFYFYLNYTDAKRVEAEQAEFTKMDEPTRKIRDSFRPSTDLIMPLNDLINKELKDAGKTYNAKDRPEMYKAAARKILERRLSDGEKKDNGKTKD